MNAKKLTSDVTNDPKNENKSKRVDVKVLKLAPSAEKHEKPEPKKKLRVAAYCRVSTELNEQKSSLKAQTEAFLKLIEANPEWELAEVYADEGISGTQTLHRDAFNRMISDCKAGKIDYIITKSISRFARNTLECIAYVRELKNLGVYMYFEKEKMDTKNEASEMVLSILAAIAQEESRNISENVKWSQRKRYSEGKALWTATFGFKKENGKTFVVDERTAPIVRRIFHDYVRGKKSAQIAAELREEGVEAPKGGIWKTGTVNFLLKNEKYCGDAQCQKSYVIDHITHRRKLNDWTVVPGYYIHNHHTPIVDRKIFDMAQEIRALRSRHGQHIQYPYGGRITCPICGEKLKRTVLSRVGSPAVWHCTPDKGNVECAGYYVGEAYIDEALRRAYAALTHLSQSFDRGKLYEIERAANIIQEIPVLGDVTYYFLDAMVEEITFDGWDTLVVRWKLGLEDRIDIRYKNEYDTPFCEKQRTTAAVKQWLSAAEEAQSAGNAKREEDTDEGNANRRS